MRLGVHRQRHTKRSGTLRGGVEEVCSRQGKWGASVARCSPNRACLIRQRGPFRYRWHLYDRPDNGGYHTERKDSLYTSVDPVSPPPGGFAAEIGNQMSETRSVLLISEFRLLPSAAKPPGGGAGYRPRVRSAYYAAVYRHRSGKPERDEYRSCGRKNEGKNSTPNIPRPSQRRASTGGVNPAGGDNVSRAYPAEPKGARGGIYGVEKWGARDSNPYETLSPRRDRALRLPASASPPTRPVEEVDASSLWRADAEMVSNGVNDSRCERSSDSCVNIWN